MYEVIDQNAETGSPLELTEIRERVTTGLLTSDAMARDTASGQTFTVGQLLAQVPEVTPNLPTSGVRELDSSEAALLGRRLGAVLIDALIALPLQIGSCIPIIGLLFAPLLCLYWLSLDSIMGGRSVGKKVMGLRVACLDGSPFVWQHSAKRHFLAVIILLEMIPVIGLFGVPLTLIGAVVEIVLIVTTGRRLGDRFANTQVISDRA